MKVLGFRHGGLLIKVVRVPDTNAVNIYFQPSQIFGLCYPGPGGSNVILPSTLFNARCLYCY